MFRIKFLTYCIPVKTGTKHETACQLTGFKILITYERSTVQHSYSICHVHETKHGK